MRGARVARRGVAVGVGRAGGARGRRRRGRCGCGADRVVVLQTCNIVGAVDLALDAVMLGAGAAVDLGDADGARGHALKVGAAEPIVERHRAGRTLGHAVAPIEGQVRMVRASAAKAACQIKVEARRRFGALALRRVHLAVPHRHRGRDCVLAFGALAPAAVAQEHAVMSAGQTSALAGCKVAALARPPAPALGVLRPTAKDKIKKNERKEERKKNKSSKEKKKRKDNPLEGLTCR